jgi:hypothetical protein
LGSSFQKHAALATVVGSHQSMQSSTVALAGAAVLAMAGTTEAFAPALVSGRTAVRSAAKGVAAAGRQAPGRAASIAGLRMVAVDPVAVRALRCAPRLPPARDRPACHRACPRGCPRAPARLLLGSPRGRGGALR